MRVGARPPSRRPWLPPASEGGPALRQPQRPRRLAEVKRGCCCGVGGGWPGDSGQGRAGPPPPQRGEGRVRTPGRCPVFCSRSASSEAPAEVAPTDASASGGLWEARGSVPSGC